MVPLTASPSRIRPRHASLRLEPLEDRSVPAGVVNATFAAGVLTITAIDDPTDVAITNTNHQNITLDGAGANNFTVTANNLETGTAITGIPFSGVTSIKFIMGVGDDTVTITDAVLTGAVTYLGGSGDNRLFIDGAGNFSGFAGASPGNVTIGSLSVTNGDGSDATRIGGGTHKINGNVSIANGIGGSDVEFGAGGTDVTSVGGTVKVTNLAGFDTVGANGTTATFTGAITINNGNGGSTIDIVATTNTLTGGITVTNGDGNDDFATSGTSFTVGTPTARKNITIINGTGAGSNDQVLDATTNTINGNICVTGSVGDDDFSVNGDTFRVLGSVKVSTGNGGGTTSISPGLVVDIDGAVSVTAGEGTDRLDFAGATSVDLASVTFTSGNGSSTLNFDGGTTMIVGNVSHTHLAGGSTTIFDATNITINGTITSTHGDGNDTFDLGGTNFTSGAITIRNGNGTGTTRIDAGTSNTILGNISITNGDGSDTFSTGGTTFTLGTPTARRNLTMNNGNGGSSATFAATTYTIHGNITATNGTGFDTFDVTGGGVFNVTGAGNVTISNGIGGSDTNFLAGSSSSIGGKLIITGTDGSDIVTMNRLTMTGTVSINTGNGDDDVIVNNSIFNGLFTFAGGGGADAVRIENGDINDGVSTVFNAAVNINTGNGDDEVLIGVLADADDFGDFNAAVTITGGLDLDIIQALSNGANTFAIAPLKTGFEQGT